VADRQGRKAECLRARYQDIDEEILSIGQVSIPEQYSPNVPFESSPVCAVTDFPGRAPEDRKIGHMPSPILLPMVGRGISVIKLREMMMVLDLHRQGLSVSAIAR
jgi:hypothetical protein